MLRLFRLRSGLSQGDLADMAHLSWRSISDLERGVRQRAYAPTVEALSMALRLSDDESRAFAAAVRRARPRQSLDPIFEVPAPPWASARTELPLLLDELANKGQRLITLTGPPRVGKTRLALEAGRALKRRFGIEVHYLSLELEPDPRTIIGLVRQVLDPSDPAVRSLPRKIAAGKAMPNRLLILDNLEHLLPLMDEVSAILSRYAGLSVLLVSRTPIQRGFEIALPRKAS